MSDRPYELAGDHITLEHSADGTSTLRFSDQGIGRSCGTCTLCCKLVPVPGPPLHKPAGVKCRHQRTGKGCLIHAERPFACRVWACRWLADRETAGMPRPDRSHYVIDIQEDYIEQVYEDGTRYRCGVIQVWIDPAFRAASRAPELRAYMLGIAERYRMATILRYNAREAVVVFPPPLTGDGEWHEIADGTVVIRSEDDAAVMDDLKRYELGFADQPEGRP
jgi:hypothetical protein